MQGMKDILKDTLKVLGAITIPTLIIISISYLTGKNASFKGDIDPVEMSERDAAQRLIEEAERIENN